MFDKYPTFIKHHKATYAIQMGWPRWGPTARRKWLRELRQACMDTIMAIDRLLGEDV